MKEDKVLVIDCETGGLEADKHSLLSMAAVVWNKGKIEESIELFIKHPIYNLTAGAMKVNKINLVDHDAKAIPATEAADKLLGFCLQNFPEVEDGQQIVMAGHNISFDRYFLEKQLLDKTFGLKKLFSHRLLDTLSAVRILKMADKLPEDVSGLSSVIEYFKIELSEEDRHTALGDAKATAQILTKILEVVK